MVESKPKDKPLRRSLYDENFIQSFDNNDARAVKGIGIDLNLGKDNPIPISDDWSHPYAPEASQMSP
jgi:hypothetical protein